MTRTESLAAPSYEAMTAGVRISAGGVVAGADVQSVVPDPEVMILDPLATRPLAGVSFDSKLSAATAGLALGAARRGRPRRVTSPSFAIASTTWTRIDAVSGEAVGRAGTYSDSLRRLRAQRATDPKARIAPAHAVRIPA
jgi:hypothetical protein